MLNTNRTIIDYYDECESDYRIFWDLDRSLAMHAGYWDESTRTLHEALVRENEVLAETVGILRKDRVLDAGCGVGGSSIFLAKNYGCDVVGITLSAKQVEKATESAIRNGVETLVTFEVRDFCQTGFPDATFDVVWGMESVCHAADKGKFVQEASRLLKKGGRLVVADGFALKESYVESESRDMQKWLRGWGVSNLDTVDCFEHHLKANDFNHISYRDITSHVLPSSRRLYFISFPALVFSKIGEWIGVRKKIQTDNIFGAYYQYTTLKNKLWTYGIFCATKNA